jgi:hypothetical protein
MIVQVFIFLLVLALWVQIKPEGFSQLWANEDKMDYSGNDISSLSGVSFNDCKKKCITNSSCKGIVTDFSGDGPGNCWLKSAFGTGSSNDTRFTYKLNRR